MITKKFKKNNDFDENNRSGFLSCSVSSTSSNSSIDSLTEFEIQKKIFQMMPVSSLPTKQYSLEPDMIFGWRPKIRFNGPIILNFKDLLIESIIRSLYRNNEYNLIYLGFRPSDSFALHELYSKENSYKCPHLSIFKEKYANILNYLNIKYLNQDFTSKNRPFLGMNKNYNYENDLIFDSMFEGGNLDAVIKLSDREYDCYMRVDSNTKGHNQWYYFEVSNGKKKGRVKFNISNFTKKNSLYLRGMRPYVFSKKFNERTGIEWIQKGENISYNQKKLLYNDLLIGLSSDKKYYTLSFDYEFDFLEDKVSFAYCVPYSYSKLTNFLNEIKINHKNQYGKENKYVSQTQLCLTLSGIEVPLLTITDLETQIFEKKLILISGRIHPGETNGSWMMHGLISFLISENNIAQQLRKTHIFKIVPMMNPDGVILGNYRTNMAGKDLNRQFKNTNDILFPTVSALKNLAFSLKKEYRENFNMFFDLHGHSLKRNVFIYGPEYSIQSENYYECRFIPKILEKKIEMFRYRSCKFRISESKKSTGRAVIIKDCDVKNGYTIEASFGNFINKYQDRIDFDNLLYEKMGNAICESIFEYYEIMFKYKYFVKQNSDSISENIISNNSNINMITDFNENSNKNHKNIINKTLGNNKYFSDSEEKNKKIEQYLENNHKKTKKKTSLKNTILKKLKLNNDSDQNLNKIKKHSNFNLFFKKIINEIDENPKKIDEHQSDNYSENKTDSESSDEDLELNEIKQLHNYILKSKNCFNKIFLDDNLYEKIIEKKNKIEKPKKKKKIKHKIQSANLINKISKKEIPEQEKPKENIIKEKKRIFLVKPYQTKNINLPKVLNNDEKKKKNNNPELNLINFNYLHENNSNSQNLVYMQNIENLMKKMEKMKGKNKNQLPFKYYKGTQVEKEESKKELKSYQFLFEIKKENEDEEDENKFQDPKKTRFSSIPCAFHSMNKYNRKKK